MASERIAASLRNERAKRSEQTEHCEEREARNEAMSEATNIIVGRSATSGRDPHNSAKHKASTILVASLLAFVVRSAQARVIMPRLHYCVRIANPRNRQQSI